MFRIPDFFGTCIVGCVLALALTAASGSAVARSKESILYRFCSQPNCTDIYWPSGGLIMDSAGNLYGTAQGGGGCARCGTVFRLNPDRTETVLHAFTGGSDGEQPSAGLLTRDPKGDLYGTTVWGGGENGCYVNIGCGTLFKIAPDGAETVVHSFAGGQDGAEPLASLVRDDAGNLYGATQGGGRGACTPQGCGTVYKITPDRKETILYRFCSQPDCADGDIPYGGLVADSAGNLYGTALRDGEHGQGVVFRLTPHGTYTVLYNFCSQEHCTDGEGPTGSLVLDSEGNLYGTTQYGGTPRCGFSGGGCGTVYKLSPDGTETVLYALNEMTGQINSQPPFGILSNGGLTADNAGNLYGITSVDGRTNTDCLNYRYGCGMVFELKRQGAGQAHYSEKVLYMFCAQTGCKDGDDPAQQLTLDSAGNLYGVTESGDIKAKSGSSTHCRNYGCGVVFKLER